MQYAPDFPQGPRDKGLQGWETVLAGHLARDFIAEHGSIPGMDEADLEQEVLLHWVSQCSRYDATRGASIQTFFRNVSKHRLADVCREQTAEKRGGGRVPRSLDEPVGDPQEGTVFGDFIGDQGCAVSDVEGDVERENIVRRLNPRQRELVRRLEAGYSLVDISHQMKVPRTTLNDELSRIKRLLRKEGYDSGSV